MGSLSSNGQETRAGFPNQQRVGPPCRAQVRELTSSPAPGSRKGETRCHVPSALSHGAFFLLGCPEGTGDTPGLGGGLQGAPEARRPGGPSAHAPGGPGQQRAASASFQKHSRRPLRVRSADSEQGVSRCWPHFPGRNLHTRRARISRALSGHVRFCACEHLHDQHPGQNGKCARPSLVPPPPARTRVTTTQTLIGTDDFCSETHPAFLSLPKDRQRATG